MIRTGFAMHEEVLATPARNQLNCHFLSFIEQSKWSQLPHLSEPTANQYHIIKLPFRVKGNGNCLNSQWKTKSKTKEI